MSVFRADILDGKVAFVTGGGSGIGKAIVEALMAHGANTVIMSRNLEKLSLTAAELENRYHTKCLAVQGDVREPEQVEAAIDQTIHTFGRLDHVVNAAAGNFISPASALSYNGFATVLAIDTQGTFNVSKAAFSKWMKEHGGHILNISMTLHYTGTPFQVHAGSAKAAIDAMTRHLAVEWGPLGIRVNAIAPGPIAGTEGMRRLAPTPEILKKLESRVPLQRFGDASEIGDLSVFLSSEAAKWVTGAIYVMDGGAWLAGQTLFN